MYHCNIQLYLIGSQCSLFKALKETDPLERFTHTFLESSEPEETLIKQADVIFTDLQGLDAEKVSRTLAAYKKKEAELVWLAGSDQAALLADGLLESEDIWIMPASEKELRFRFRKWQHSYKLKKDLWQSDHFLKACINSSPDMIWFKDKNGIHEIVNDSFCKVVNKTKEQVQGRGHAYIWNVEQDDPPVLSQSGSHAKERNLYVR